MNTKTYNYFSYYYCESLKKQRKMSIIQKLKDSTIPSVYSAAASLGLFYVLVDNNLTMKVPFGNMQLPVYAAVGGASFIGSELGMLLTDYVAPKVPMIKDFEGVEKTILPAALAGASSWIVMKTLISSETDFKQAFIIGAGGNMIGQTLYDNMKMN